MAKKPNGAVNKGTGNKTPPQHSQWKKGQSARRQNNFAAIDDYGIDFREVGVEACSVARK